MFAADLTHGATLQLLKPEKQLEQDHFLPPGPPTHTSKAARWTRPAGSNLQPSTACTPAKPPSCSVRPRQRGCSQRNAPCWHTQQQWRVCSSSGDDQQRAQDPQSTARKEESELKRDADQGSDRTSNEASSSGTDGSLWTSGAKLVAEIVASPLFYFVAGAIAIKLVASTGEQAVSVFLFAAAPITLLTALSKSSLGAAVQASLNEKLPQLDADAAQLRQQHAEARQSSPWYGHERPQVPAALGGQQQHLTGAVAGDYGWDPLGLAKDPQAFGRYYEAELLHARWAMLAAVGCLVPEALSLNGVDLGEPVWWKVGAAKARGDITLNWGGIEGFRIAGKQGIGIIAACQLVLMGGPEYARYVGIRSLEPVGVHLPGDANYPGGVPFDPLNCSQRPAFFVDQAVREAKNGRLAMLAMLGYFVQAAVTRKGPVQNLLDFCHDPAHNNVLGYLGLLPGGPSQ